MTKLPRVGDFVCPATAHDVWSIQQTYYKSDIIVSTESEFEVLVVVEKGSDRRWRNLTTPGVIVRPKYYTKPDGGLIHSYPYVWDFRRWRVV